MELLIERLGVNGEGVARREGFTLFIEGALPDEKVYAEMVEKRKTYGRAELTEVVIPSPDRVEPPCPYFGRCGGCQLMHLSYEKQLAFKRQRVVDALVRIGKFSDCEVLSCLPSPNQLGYRNKIQLPVVDGRVGLYERSSHNLVQVDQCLIHCDVGEEVLSKVLETLVERGDIRHILIKTAVHTKQVLVILVTRSRSFSEEVAQKLLGCHPKITGVVQNINGDEGNVILGPEFRVLAGQGWIEEILLGLRFKVSPLSFFQVNPPQAESLYETVVSFADLKGGEKLLDAYCGVGTLSLILAQRGAVVIGVESVPEAIADAEENGRKNGIASARFICSTAEESVSQLGEVDIAVVNPPRKGCEKAFLDGLNAQKIIYVSCDPATLARDLRILCDRGYRVVKVQPFDMFPQTAHVETVVLVERCFGS